MRAPNALSGGRVLDGEDARFDGRPPVPTAVITLRCPSRAGCGREHPYAWTARVARHRFACPTCGEPFGAWLGFVDSLAVEQAGGVRNFRLEARGLGGERARFAFADASHTAFAPPSRRAVVLVHDRRGELRQVVDVEGAARLDLTGARRGRGWRTQGAEMDELQQVPAEPKDRWGRLILLAIALIAVVATIGYLRRPGLPAAGSDTPQLQLALLDGERVGLDAWHGKVVLLDFWATWCQPCIASMPTVHRVAEDLADEGVIAVAVNGDVSDKREQLVRHFLRKHELEGLRVALDDGSAAEAFSVTGLPTMVVIGRDGKVAATHLGAADEAELRKLLEGALAPTPQG